MKYLLIVDLQKEFAIGEKGVEVYNKCIEFVKEHSSDYDSTIACVYVNIDNPNMQRLVQWDGCKSIQGLDFDADKYFQHSGYSIGAYDSIVYNDEVDVIGFDTDACVLNACFDLFNIGCKLRILTDYVYSSGGQNYHIAGLMIMKRQFGRAVI